MCDSVCVSCFNNSSGGGGDMVVCGGTPTLEESLAHQGFF